LSGAPNILASVPSKKEKLPLSVTNPELAREAVGWDPHIYQPVSAVFEWVCPGGHTFKARIYDRKRGRNCAVCAGRQVVPGVNDLATTHRELASQADGWDPSRITAGSHQKLDWICGYGHKTKSTVKNRALLGNECAVCVNQEVLPGFNDLASQYPEVAKSLIGKDPSQVIPGSNKKFTWKCPSGHLYIQSVNQRVNGQGCNICSGKKILKGFNDLESRFPDVAQEAFGWNPSEIFAGTHAKKNFRCFYGHFYRAIVKDRTTKGSGCPICSKHGYNPGKPGFLYFLEHPRWGMLQIGITNNVDQRTVEHKKKGWEIIEIRGPIDGLLAMNWESAILRMLKARGADLSNASIAGKFDGYSEAWSETLFPVKSLKELMNLTEEFEESEK
jgi:hypothetical protein